MAGTEHSGSNALSAPVRFTDVVAVPALPKQNVRQHHCPVGGPIWPDFERQTGARFCRYGKPFDDEPHQPETQPRPVSEPAFWGGFAIPHFGHLISEQLTRLMSYWQSGEDWPVYFTIPAGTGIEDVPGYFYDLCAWLGLPRERVRFLTEPVRFAELWVAPQAEQMQNEWPADGYVDALDQRVAQSSLVPDECDLLFVTRAGLAQAGKDTFAGEHYLVRQLRRLGVSILDPAEASLDAQIAAYAGARHIVYVEGSAVHGRQLLGALPQRVSVLQRRPDFRIAKRALTARTEEVDYHDVIVHTARLQQIGNDKLRGGGLGFFGRNKLFRAFQGFGVDLSDGWSQPDFKAEVEQDALTWLKAIREQRPTVGFWRKLGTVREVFATMGLEHLWASLDAPDSDPDDPSRPSFEASVDDLFRSALEAGSKKHWDWTGG